MGVIGSVLTFCLWPFLKLFWRHWMSYDGYCRKTKQSKASVQRFSKTKKKK